MDTLQLAELRMQFLGEQASRADARIAALAQEGLIHRGGNQHLGALATLIEGHRDRLRGSQEANLAKATGDPGPDSAQGAIDAERVKSSISGLHDALAYLRAQVRAADLSASQAEASLAEMQRHREDLSAQGRAEQDRIGHLRQQLAAGTTREDLGRPDSAAEVSAEVARRRADAREGAGPPAGAQADAPGPAPAPAGARSRGRARAP